MPGTYTILLVDDHPIYIEGLTLALKHLLANTRLLSALNGDDALKILAEVDVDLVLTDFRMPGEDGLDLRRRIADAHPSVAVGLLCADPRPELARRARELGAVSYLSKERNIESMADAVRRLLAGETVFDITAPQADMKGISDRRLDILRMGARGLSNKEIARLLNVGERTIKDHWSVIFERMGVRNRVQAISVAHARGLLDESTPPQ